MSLSQLKLPPGLTYQSNFLTFQGADKLLQEIDAQPWSSKDKVGNLQRRVQHYGYYYDFKQPKKTPEPAPPFPPLIAKIAQRLVETEVFDRIPDQCIINEYTRKQGINAHADAFIFCEPIVTISLGSEAIMTFSPIENYVKYDTNGNPDRTLVNVLLEPGSIAIMSGEARWEWTHSISPNITYYVGSEKRTRPNDFRRVSITFRSYD